MNHHTPSLSEVVDVLTARLEYAEEQGDAAERKALRTALTVVEDHAFRDERHRFWIARIFDRLTEWRVAA